MPLPCHQHECLKTPFKDFVNIQTNQYSMNANNTRKSPEMAAGSWLLEYKFNALTKPAIMCWWFLWVTMASWCRSLFVWEWWMMAGRVGRKAGAALLLYSWIKMTQFGLTDGATELREGPGELMEQHTSRKLKHHQPFHSSDLSVCFTEQETWYPMANFLTRRKILSMVRFRSLIGYIVTIARPL